MFQMKISERCMNDDNELWLRTVCRQFFFCLYLFCACLCACVFLTFDPFRFRLHAVITSIYKVNKQPRPSYAKTHAIIHRNFGRTLYLLMMLDFRCNHFWWQIIYNRQKTDNDLLLFFCKICLCYFLNYFLRFLCFVFLWVFARMRTCLFN